MYSNSNSQEKTGGTDAGILCLEDISRFRGELMGLAMLFIILFHVWVRRDDPFFGLHRCGNVGVDIFLFLSGVGLWFAWTRNPGLRRFYTRRFARIFPAWFIMACLFYVPDFLGRGRYSSSVGDLIGDITINLDFWMHDELTFWYIPAIMALYIAAPLYMKLIGDRPVFRWLPVLMVVWCVMVQWVTPIHSAVGHIEIFWSRVPIFFIGINAGQFVLECRCLQRGSMSLLIVAFVMTFGTCLYLEQALHGEFPLFVERMIYIFALHTPMWTKDNVNYCKTLLKLEVDERLGIFDFADAYNELYYKLLSNCQKNGIIRNLGKPEILVKYAIQIAKATLLDWCRSNAAFDFHEAVRTGMEEYYDVAPKYRKGNSGLR